MVAFDGNPDNIVRLRENRLRNNMDDRLQVIHAAAWSYTAPGGIAFRCGKAYGGVEADGVRPVLASGELINVPAITLDDFITAGGPAPNLVKIDAEGGEYEVLRGGVRLFATQRPLLIAEIHGHQPAEQISEWLAEYRYSAEWKIPREEFPRHVFAWPGERVTPSW